MKRRNMNLDPSDLTINQDGAGRMKITISAWTGKNNAVDTRVHLSLDRWWVKIMADELHAYLRKERADLDECYERLRRR